jgi:hypothetical protein
LQELLSEKWFVDPSVSTGPNSSGSIDAASFSIFMIMITISDVKVF